MQQIFSVYPFPKEKLRKRLCGFRFWNFWGESFVCLQNLLIRVIPKSFVFIILLDTIQFSPPFRHTFLLSQSLRQLHD